MRLNILSRTCYNVEKMERPLDRLCKYFKVRPSAPSSNLNAVNTGFRWASAEPYWSIEDPWPVRPMGLPESLDLFIDRHLWWAPAPRFARRAESDSADSNVIWTSCTELLAHMMPNLEVDVGLPGHDARILPSANEIYKQKAPLFSIMREPKTSVYMCALIAVLLALDLPFTCQIDTKVFEAWRTQMRSWSLQTYEAVVKLFAPLAVFDDIAASEIVGFEDEPYDAALWRTVLIKADAALRIRMIHEAVTALPLSSPEWLPFSEATTMFSVPDSVKQVIDEKIQTYADCTGLRPETLYKNCRIKDLAEEDIQIGFQFENI